MARVQWSHFNAHSVYAWSYLDINLILDLAFFLWKKIEKCAIAGHLNSYLKLANGYLKLGNEFETNKYTYYGMLSLVYISQKTVISNKGVIRGPIGTQ